MISVFDLGDFKFFFERNENLLRDTYCKISKEAISSARAIMRIANVTGNDEDAKEICELLSFYNEQIYLGLPENEERVCAKILNKRNEDELAKKENFAKSACILRMCATYDFGQVPNFAIADLCLNSSAIEHVVTICKSNSYDKHLGA